MSISFNFLRSLILASFLSFVVPVGLLALLLLGLFLLGQVPLIAALGQTALDQCLQFLATFGNGDVKEGIVVIGLVGSTVGIMFDTFVFYQQQHLHKG
jgi:hypothetical protein